MEKDDFRKLLNKAGEEAVTFSRHYVTDDLPPGRRYFINIRQAHEELKPSERTFENLAMSLKEFRGPLTESEVVEILWVAGAIPVWVDVSVYQTDEEYSYLDLRVCNRFSSIAADYYYGECGMGPFGIKSPSFPPSWNEAKGKFSLMERVRLFQHHRIEFL